MEGTPLVCINRDRNVWNWKESMFFSIRATFLFLSLSSFLSFSCRYCS